MGCWGVERCWLDAPAPQTPSAPASNPPLPRLNIPTQTHTHTRNTHTRAHPAGRLINRFTKDTEALDTQMGQAVNSALACLVGVVLSVIAVAVVSPYVIIAMVPLSYLYYRVHVRALDRGGAGGEGRCLPTGSCSASLYLRKPCKAQTPNHPAPPPTTSKTRLLALAADMAPPNPSLPIAPRSACTSPPPASSSASTPWPSRPSSTTLARRSRAWPPSARLAASASSPTSTR